MFKISELSSTDICTSYPTLNTLNTVTYDLGNLNLNWGTHLSYLINCLLWSQYDNMHLHSDSTFVKVVQET